LKQLSKLYATSVIALACGLASLPAQAQTYSAGTAGPTWTTVATPTLTTTASSAKFDAPFVGYYGQELFNSANPAATQYSELGVSGSSYASATFTETAGLYNFNVSGSGYTNLLSQVVYDGTFTPSTSTRSTDTSLKNAYSGYLTGATGADNTPAADSGSYQELLPAGTGTGTVVDFDLYPSGSVANFTSLGSDSLTISELAATIIPANTAAGVSMSLTDLGTGVLGTTTSLSSLDILGLDSSYDGDLSATITHDGVTVSLFDRVGASANNYNQGTWGLMSNVAGISGSSSTSNVYSFANSGANLAGFDDDATVTGGTYALSNSGTANGGNNDDATTFAAFNGLSEAGTWTLNISSLAAGDLAYFTGFDINIAPTPEASSIISMAFAVSLLMMLVWKARRNRFEVTALGSDNNE
jgi:hypothetical protein